MNWNELRHSDDLQSLLDHSYTEPCFIFKHSTRCSISSVALRRIERSGITEQISARWFLVNVIARRPVSDQIEQDLRIRHESPQLIMVIDGQAVWDVSHLAISPGKLPAIVDDFTTN